ncbi:hypothetical protein [Herbiconiux sp. YIM B11900]|uniref:hypothetical protein n=1 Tax=Herbiconiux sp. YIM B11900 TaxID=3404131 RepID=UPI003F8537FF
MRRARSLLAALVIVALVSGVSGCTSFPWSKPVASAGLDLTPEQLQSTGIAIVADETAVPDAPTSLTMTEIQADRMIAEAAAGVGRTGAELDAIAPVDPSYPRMSYLLAAYLSADDLPGEHPGADLARTLYATSDDRPEPTDWTHPESVVFPMAVVALFVQDLMTAAQAEGSFVAEDPVDEGAGVGPAPDAAAAPVEPAAFRTAPDAPSAPAGIVDAPCTTVTGFISKTIQGLFDVLRVIPGEISKISELGIFGVLLGALIDHAIGLAQGVVEGLVSVVTAPVLNALRIGLSGLGTASLVLSYFTNERLVVKPGPADHTAFSIDPDPGTKGTFTASTLSLTKDWPAALVDCAKVSGATIPPLIRPGDPATWTIQSGVTLISLDRTETKILADKTAVVEFTTGHEDAETANGPEITEAARVSVTVPRKEVGEFLDLAAKQVESVKNDILAKVPSFLQNAASIVLNAAIDPVVASVRGSLEEVAGETAILNLKGDGMVWVTHHEPKEPDPAPGADPDPEPAPNGDDGDFCTQFDEQAAIAAAALPGAADPFSWAAGFAAGLHSITAAPPAELAGDFGTVVQFYDIAATSSFGDAQALADFVDSHDVDGARVRLWAACGATQIDGF